MQGQVRGESSEQIPHPDHNQLVIPRPVTFSIYLGQMEKATLYTVGIFRGVSGNRKTMLVRL